MVRSGPGRGRRDGRLLVTGLAAVAAAMLTGCGTGAADVALPVKPGHVHLAGAKAAPPSARDLVVAAYEGYWRATNEALASRDPARASAIMASYVPGDAIPALVKGLRALWARNEIGYGSPVFHILSVKITGRGTAAVHDCVDLSHTGFQNQQTGQVAGGFGQSHDFLITTLALEHGRWLVTGAIPVVQTCAY
ncbi:MAG TPA: hypothetical protein VMU94_03125 [Streptosporangiaceae bacterium]|nr:hypothetical protein [Streptosporangiaceae bacterium]